MVAIGLGSGLKIDAALFGGLGQRVGEQARGAATLAEHEHALAVEVTGGRCLSGDNGGSVGLHGLGSSAGGNALGIGLALEGIVELGGLLGVLGGELLLGNLGLLGALLGVVGTEERVVQNEVDDQDKGEHHKGERLEAQAHDGADGAGDSPGQGVHKAVHAQEVDKDLEDPDVGDRGKDKRDKEDGVEHDGRGEQQRLVDGKADGDDGGLTDGAHLLRLGQEAEHKDQDERGAGAAHADDEVLGTLGQDSGSVLASLERSQVVGHVGNESGGDGGLDDRGAVDAHEPEQAHGAVDHSEADVAIGSGEQGLEHLDDALGKAEAKSSAEDDVKNPKDGDADGEGDDVLEGLRDVGRNLLGHLDGDVALNEELVDDAGHKRSDEGGQQALGTKVGGVEAAGGVRGDRVARKEQEADDGRAHA